MAGVHGMSCSVLDRMDGRNIYPWLDLCVSLSPSTLDIIFWRA